MNIERTDLKALLRLRQDRWVERISAVLDARPGDAHFDGQFLKYLVSLLEREGFSNLAHAILRSGLDLAITQRTRDEFDALVDLGIEIMARVESEK